MFCANCGKKIDQDAVYCPECGMEIQLVPEYVDLDTIMMEAEKAERVPEKRTGASEIRKTQLKKKQDARRKNRVLIIQIVGLALFIAIAITFLIIFMSAQSKNTDSYQIKMAEGAMKDKDYKTALEYYKKAREINSKNLDVVKGIAECYDQLGDLESAVLYYREIAEKEPGNTEIFQRILEIYSELEDQDSIRELYAMVKTQNIRDLFASYLLAEPQFSIEEGTYNELKELTLSLAEDGEIYYTTDGSRATQESTVYEDPIPLEEGKTVIHAIAVTSSGQVSDEIIKTYEIALETPKAPGISPESGKYSEATRIELTIPEGATAYYTTDGTVPTEESKICGQSIAMPIGNNIISVMYIDKNGKTSEIVKRNYNLTLSLPVSTDEAETAMLEGLLQKGEVDNMDGYKAGDDGVFEFHVLAVDTIYSEDYYIMERTKKFFSGETSFIGYYAYKISDGKLYKATLDETGSYRLSAF